MSANIKDLYGVGAEKYEIRTALEQKFDNYDLIDRAMDVIGHGVLEQQILELSGEYKITLDNIKMYTSSIERAN